MTLENEELIGLGVLLAIIVSLALLGHLSSDAVEGIKWVGAAFFASKGLGKFTPVLPATPPKPPTA